MSIKLDEKVTARDIYALGCDESERRAKVNDTYNVVVGYWKYLKKTYADLVNMEHTKEDTIIEVMKNFNTPLHFDWRADRILIGSPHRYRVNDIPKDDIEDINFRMTFSKRSFYYKLLKKEQSLEDDSKELIKYLKKAFLKKVKDQRVSLLKIQIGDNNITNISRVNALRQFINPVDILQYSESRARCEKLMNIHNITKESFNQLLNDQLLELDEVWSEYRTPIRLCYSAWQRLNGFEPYKISKTAYTYGSTVSSDLIGCIVACEDLKIPLCITLEGKHYPDTLNLKELFGKFFGIVRKEFTTEEELLLAVVENQELFNNLKGRIELSSARYVDSSLMDDLLDDSNFDWVKIVKK